jgi:hypothetical protein
MYHWGSSMLNNYEKPTISPAAYILANILICSTDGSKEMYIMFLI